MVIHVFDGDQSRQFSSTELNSQYNLEFVLASVGSARNLLELDAAVRSIDQSRRRAAHRFIFRMPAYGVTDPDAFKIEDDLAMLKGRLEGIPFSFLCRDKDRHPHFIFHSDNAANLNNQDQIIEALRTAELRSLLKQPGVELPAVPDFHYKGPNGRHYSRFLRVGFAMTQTSAIDAFLFWTEESLANTTTLLVDTGGMLTLAYAAQAARPELTVHNLTGYNDSLPRLRVAAGADATLLISVSSSGAMASRLKKTWREQHGGTLRVVSLFGYQGFTPEQGDTLVCPLGEELKHHSNEDCPLCTSEKPSPLIPIDSHTYLLEIGGATVPCRIREIDASEAKLFFTRYAGVGVVQLHRNDDTGRHHMVYVDIAPLLQHKPFLERLSEKVKTIKEKRQIQHVICPDHQNAIALAKQVITELGLEANALLIANERETNKLQGLSEKRRSKSHCLIVDDVLISGHRIRGYKNALHRCGFDFGGNELSFLVAVDRSPTNDDRSKVKNMLDHGDSFFPIENLILPHWDRKQCPWCKELQAIKRTMHIFPEDDYMRKRFAHISQPIHNDPFLPGKGGAPESLGQTSIFSPANANAVEVFASVASSIQNLRSVKHLNDHRDIPIAKILQNEYTFKGRYYDTIVTAAILRATHEYDIRTFSIDPDLRDEFSKRLNEAGGAELYGEIIFACSRGSLPPLDNLEATCESLAEEFPGVGSFLSLLNKS